jgi:hypothetical protein
VVLCTCSCTFLNHVVKYFEALLFACCTLASILYSYSKIVSSICAISTTQGKYRHFLTMYLTSQLSPYVIANEIFRWKFISNDIYHTKQFF